MKGLERKTLATGVVVVISILCIGAAIFLTKGHEKASQLDGKALSSRREKTSSSSTIEDIESLRSEIERLKGGMTGLKKSSAEMNHKILQHDRTLNTAMAGADFGASPSMASAEEEALPALTAEEEMELADAEVRSQLELMEETVLTEETDAEWSKEAELALDQVYSKEEMEQVERVDVECRTTLCRIELFFDESAIPEEAFRNLAHLTPWEGEGFMRMDDGDKAQAVVYLAREGHSLPKLFE